MYWNALLFCMIPSLSVAGGWGWWNAHAALYPLRRRRTLGLGVWLSLPLEGFGEALLPQVPVPQLGKALMLRV